MCGWINLSQRLKVGEFSVPYNYYRYSNELYHFGIKGMRWGIRRYQNDDGSLTPAGKKRYSNVEAIKSKKMGEKLYVAERRNKDPYDTERNFDIIRAGKKIGNVWLEKQGDNLYLNWIDTKKTERGKGYADSVMDYVVKYADKNNYKTMTLEVPGSSPDARHIYEKHGFQVDNSKVSDTDDVWDGLTAMKRRVR